MVSRTGDWFAQAEKDLEHALVARDSGSHEWACFASQQAAEKAVKALHLHAGQEAWGHGHPEGAPFEHYGSLQSEQAIRYAGEILAFVRARLA